MADRESRSLVARVRSIFRYQAVTIDFDNEIGTVADEVAEPDWSAIEHVFDYDSFGELEASLQHRFLQKRSRGHCKQLRGAVLQRQQLRRAQAQSQKMMNAWRSFATALMRRADGMPSGRKSQRLHRAQMRCQRELQLGKFDYPTLMPRYAQWLRSPFEEEPCQNLKRAVKRTPTMVVPTLNERLVRRQCCACSPADMCLTIRSMLYRSVAYSDVQSTDLWISIRRTVYKGVASSEFRLARWAMVTNALLSADRLVALANHRRRFIRPRPASSATFRQWLHLGCDAAAFHLQVLEQLAPPRELTLAGHCMLSDTVQLGQQAKRAQRRWSRFVNLLHEQKREEARQTSWKRSSIWKRPYWASDSSSWRTNSSWNQRSSGWRDYYEHSSGWRDYDRGSNYGWRAQNYADDWDAQDPPVAHGFSLTNVEQAAAELGLDVETYRMLRQLEQREISPEDYDLLGRLDESVKRTTLLPEDLEMFPVHRYCALVEPRLDADTIRFGMDFWRLPMELSADPDGDDSSNAQSDCECHCASFVFGKLPLAKDEDAVESTADGTGTCSEASATVCGVCLLDFEDGDEFRTLVCGHSFHKECIDHWLLNSSTVCPIDKRDVRQM